jgi:NSS family neurotransmitter:Na+ symporter
MSEVVMPRERWSSRLGFLLAGIGSAVGLGNVWRFPYITGQNGGGAFLIPYVISVLLLGIPLMMLEISVGRQFKRSVVSSMRSINGRLTWVGLFVVLVALLVLSYYLVVTGWTFAYFLYALSGTEPVFEEFTRTYNSLLFFVVVTVLMALIVARGIRSGIERTNQLLVPAFLILLLLLAVYALALPRAVDGVLFYLTPDFTRLSDYSVWLAAFGQAFFSLSVGSGILITYGSYLDESVSLPSNMGIIALTDSFISFISGLVIFPIVFSFGFEPAAGPKLAFSTLPYIFAQAQYGSVLAVIFYLLLFFAAITSAISLLEVGVTVLVDETRLSRRTATALLAGVVLLLGVPSALSYSRVGLQVLQMPVLDLMDPLFGTFAIILAALFISVSATWYVKKEVIVNQINQNARWQHGEQIFALIKFFIPFALTLIFIARIASYLV